MPASATSAKWVLLWKAFQSKTHFADAALHMQGAWLGHVVNAALPVKCLLSVVLHLFQDNSTCLEDQNAVEAELDSSSDKKQQLYEIFETLCDQIPGLEDTTDWSLVCSRLEKGKDSARTEDNHALKIALPNWKLDGKEWDPPLNAKTKDDCGLSHPVCAKLLAPISVKWDNQEERNNFRIHYNPLITETQHWPAFMYLGYEGDIQDLAKGLLRSEILAARTLLYPPTFANKDDKPDHRSNRRTKADVYGVKNITPSFLAYVAVAVRFTLSLESVFLLRGGLFNYERFYNDIMAYLNDPIFKPNTDELIEWWNTSSGLFIQEHTDPADEPESMLARLRQQAKARGQQAGDING
ncbi:hypothetical protein BN14_08532 [Rhizoctonia solani AG-1 IB]|uniref:Uncharacterized protein n=1 Tax=Thanatephorus cucumeris (strain AG1-IB / isolate 7/3/14) TaxID=1108050 RepID=M5C528_THACB|nr:hypothetical protein BN14_08532 [Rhizoctonia solani AG-1 IB]